jgi:hypothetical protein
MSKAKAARSARYRGDVQCARSFYQTCILLALRALVQVGAKIKLVPIFIKRHFRCAEEVTLFSVYQLQTVCSGNLIIWL